MSWYRKRLALTRPEAVAAIIARPMRLLSAVVKPLVYLLSASTDTVLRSCGSGQQSAGGHLEEFKVLIQQGTEEGVFEKTEHEMVSNVLRLDERRVGAIMTPRADIVFLDARAPIADNRDKLRVASAHGAAAVRRQPRYVSSDSSESTELLARLVNGEPVDLRRLASPPLFVPATMTVMRLLERFKRSHLPLALVIDELGGVAGLVSFSDVVGAVVGDLPPEPGEDPMVVARGDGSWLVDGALDLDALRRLLGNDLFAQEDRRVLPHTRRAGDAGARPRAAHR